MKFLKNLLALLVAVLPALAWGRIDSISPIANVWVEDGRLAITSIVTTKTTTHVDIPKDFPEDCFNTINNQNFYKADDTIECPTKTSNTYRFDWKNLRITRTKTTTEKYIVAATESGVVFSVIPSKVERSSANSLEMLCLAPLMFLSFTAFASAFLHRGRVWFTYTLLSVLAAGAYSFTDSSLLVVLFFVFAFLVITAVKAESFILSVFGGAAILFVGIGTAAIENSQDYFWFIVLSMPFIFMIREVVALPLPLPLKEKPLSGEKEEV